MGPLRLLQPFARYALCVTFVGFLAAAQGCSLVPSGPMPAAPHYAATKITDLAAQGENYPPVDRTAADALASLADGPRPPVGRLVSNARPSKPLNVLVLSGGGQYAAFAGGVLVGWTESGKRPDFDVVTGVSSGAWLAIYAFLGPKYDPNVKHMAETLKTSDVFPYQPVINWLRYDSIAAPDRLQRLIDKEFPDELIADIRAAHQAGRRLFIGTMNQRTRRLVIWDIGTIACSGPQPEANRLVRKIFVASCSISGIVPPVDFEVEVNGVRYHEEHADGGAVSQAFVRFGRDVSLPDPAHPDAKWLAGSNLYAIAGGKLYADTLEDEMGLLGRVKSTISGTLYALYRADLWRVYSLCLTSGMKFHHVAVPQDAQISPSSTDFDLKTMQKLFNLGHDAGLHGDQWRETPPGYDENEAEIPRAGLRFTIP